MNLAFVMHTLNTLITFPVVGMQYEVNAHSVFISMFGAVYCKETVKIFSPFVNACVACS